MDGDTLIEGRAAILERLDLKNWNTVKRMEREFGLPMEKIDGRWTMTERDFSAWLDRQCRRDFR